MCSDEPIASFQLFPAADNETILWAVWIPSVSNFDNYSLEVVCNNSIGFDLPRLLSVNITIPLTGLTPATTYTCTVFGKNRTELLSQYATASTFGGNGMLII